MKGIVLLGIRFFQKLNLTVGYCRFTPTCSEYTYQAIVKYGVFKGSVLGIKRLLRCNPWNKGGVDYLQ